MTGDQIVAAIGEFPNMGQGDKDKDSPNVTGAVSKKVQGAGLRGTWRQDWSQQTLKTEGTKTQSLFCQSIICFLFYVVGWFKNVFIIILCVQAFCLHEYTPCVWSARRGQKRASDPSEPSPSWL